MNRFVIRQYGYESLDYQRVFILEVPANMSQRDVDALSEECLADLADQADVEWCQGDVIGPEPERHEIEGDAQESATDQLKVVKWSEEIK
jgi:hypothetical protein